MYGCKSSCHSCPAWHRRTGPLAPRDNHSLAEGHRFFIVHCLLSTALTLSVPCSPMPMVSSDDQVAAYQVCSHPASVCLVDHVMHGDCPDVMTLGSQRRTLAFPCFKQISNQLTLSHWSNFGEFIHTNTAVGAQTATLTLRPKHMVFSKSVSDSLCLNSVRFCCK